MKVWWPMCDPWPRARAAGNLSAVVREPLSGPEGTGPDRTTLSLGSFSAVGAFAYAALDEPAPQSRMPMRLIL